MSLQLVKVISMDTHSPPHMIWILKPKFVHYTWEDNEKKKLEINSEIRLRKQ